MKMITTLCALLVIATAWAQTPTYTINVASSTMINPNARKLLGVSFDARTSMNLGQNNSVVPAGYYHPATGALLPDVQALWNRVPIAGVRYPGNPVIYNWNWKYTIGPVASRPAQTLGPNTPPQSLVFGFDEFMAMIASRGLSTRDVQIMVVIYPSVSEPDPAQGAADWVEYANAPNDGSNPGGGTDWAAIRAANGHPAPYNIRTWNIGNEPWSPNELNFDAAKYIPIAAPIIDAMLRIDATLHITLPAVGNANSAWNQALFNSAALAGKFHGLSPHYFYDEDASTPNPSVAQAQAALSSLAIAAQARGLTIIVGDHAHNAPTNDPDLAMRWQGALTTADFLLMTSQINNIELANFWIYGMPKAVWHPIRQNADGTYTLMAAAQLYETLLPFFLDQSLQTTVVNAGGGSAASIRASAFKSSNAAAASVIVANTDAQHDGKVVLPNLAGYLLERVNLVSASLNADTFQTTVAVPLADGTYSLPHAGILLFKFKQNLTAVALTSSPLVTDFNLPQNYPNPFNPATVISFQLPASSHVSLKVFDVTGREVATLMDGEMAAGKHSATFAPRDLAGGVYFYKLTAGKFSQTRKAVLMK